MNRKNLGFKGEKLACLLLQKKGYRILAQNFRTKYGEIDLVALEGKDLVLVEVKTRIGDRFGSGVEAVNQRKIKKISKAAYFLRQKFPHLPESLRIDVVSLRLGSIGELEEAEIIRNVSQN